MQIASPLRTIRPAATIEKVRGQSWAIALLAVALSLGALGLIAVLGPAMTVALILGIGIVLVTLAEPRYGLYLVVLTVPAQQYASVHGLTATQASFLLVLGAWVAGKLLRGASWDVLRDRNLWFFVVFYLVILASIRVAGDVKLSLMEAFRWGEALAIYAIARD